MRNNIIYLLVLCLVGVLYFNQVVYAQSGQKVVVTILPENPDKQTKSRFYDSEPILRSYNMIFNTEDQIISLFDNNNDPIPQEDLRNISLISLSGGDVGGFNDINAGNLIFQIVSNDGGLTWLMKKIVAMEIDQLFQLLDQNVLQTGNPTYHDLSTIGFVNNKKYIINLKLALEKITINGLGTTRYLAIKNFNVVPDDVNPNDPPWSSFYIGIVRFFFTFENLSTNKLVKYPAYEMNWGGLTTNVSRIFKLPRQLDDELFNGSYTPIVTMLVYRKNFFTGNETFLSRFDFNPGVIDAIPRSPALSLTENEFSLTLNWTPENFATAYHIYRSQSSIPDITILSPFDQVGSVTTYEDLTALPGQRYFYQVLPIRSDGMEGLVSNEANGMANSPVLLSVAGLGNLNYQKGHIFDISGNVASAKTGLPIDNASVNAFVEELSFAYNNASTNTNGDFLIVAEAPIVPGSYNYVVQTQYNTEGEGLKYNVSVFEDPSKGHDIEITNASVGGLYKQPGQNITVSYTIVNHGLGSETGVVDLALFDDQDGLVVSISQDAFTLASAGTLSKNTSFTVPSTLTDGNYYIQINLANELDEHRINNEQKTSFFVSGITNPLAYRLGAYQFDSVSHTRTIDGYAVTLISASSSTATFSINGESTGSLEIGEYWFNNAATFMLHVNAISYFNSSFLDIDIRAGANYTSYSHNPYFNVCRKDESTTTLITAPSGSQLNDQIDFIIDPDSVYLQSWLQSVSHPNNQQYKLNAEFIVPGNTSSRTYYSYAKTTDANYWWIKRMYLTPIQRRNISKYGNMSVSNITANGNPGNLTGDRFEISGSFKNNGDYNEMTIVKFCLLDVNDSIWFDHDTLNIPNGGQSNFSFTLPTLGMKAQNYVIEVVAAQPEDSAFSDNIFTANLLLEEVLEANCYFDNFAASYEAGDTIHAAVHVEHLGSTIDQANVLLEITEPSGLKRKMPAVYNAQSQSYRADYVTDLSGNYYFDASTSAKRYLNASAEAVAKVKVYLTFENTSNVLYLGNTAEFKLTTTNVGGAYAFACHFDFDEHLTPLQAYQGNLISPSTAIQSTHNFTGSNGSFELGITRLNPASFSYSAYAEHTICLITTLCSNSGSYSISIPDYTLYDHHGEAMVCNLQILESTIVDPEIFLRLIPDDTLYSFGDTLTLTTSILGKSNLQGVSFDMNYNDTILQCLGTEFHNSLGEYGDVNLLQEVEDDGTGKITLGSIRSNNSRIGCDYSIVKIAETKFIVRNAGEISFTPEHIHLLSPYEGVEFPFTLDTYSAISLPYDPNSLAFSPDTLNLWPSQHGWSQLNLSGLKNVFAVSLDLDFDTTSVHIDSITEGNLLNFDNQSTTFEYSVDSSNGKIYVGVTRMNNLVGGVTTDTIRAIFNIHVKKKVNISSVIHTSNVIIIDPLGNQYTNSFGPDLILDSLKLHNQKIPVYTGWNNVSFSVQSQQQSMVSILQELISDSSLVKVINEAGGFIQYIPGVGWMNTIGVMENTEGYYLKVSEDDTISLSGISVNIPFNIPLYYGWNNMGYPSQQVQNAIVVVQPLIDDGLFIKAVSESGGFIQNIPGFGWMNTIGNMAEGEGYYIKVNADTSLQINEPQGKKDGLISSKFLVQPVTNYYKPICNKNLYQPMHFVIVNDLILENQILIGNEMAIYDGNRCVGATVIDGHGPYLIIAGADDPTTSEIEGYKVGNNLTIKYWDSNLNQESFDFNIKQVSGSNEFSPFETWVGSLDKIPLSSMGNEVIITQNRPNPFSTSTYIDYVLKQDSYVIVQIYNINGEQVLKLIDENQLSGFYSKRVDKGHLESGLYLCEVIINNKLGVFKKIIKMIIQ